MTRPLTSVAALEKHRTKVLAGRDRKRPAISICAGTGCVAYGALELADAFRAAVAAKGLEGRVDVRINGCHGFCERGPLVLVHPHEFFYQRVQPKDVEEIIEASALGGKPLERLQYVDPATGQRAVKQDDVPFYKHQMRVLLAHNGRIDPTSIDDYIATGGYRSLARVLTEMKPEEVVELVRRSGLRGRGGGGYPAGVKWAQCRQARSADGVRYVIGNGDEGDPGAFMDRSLMEGNPHLVLEGMIIGAYAIGKPGNPVGYLYVRNEYPLAVERLGLALAKARELGLLGDDILGTGFSFDIAISRGGGAFVCGESTALMASIEGLAGQPRSKYVHTVERGLWGKPTNLNNVETWANVPLIVERGAEWFAGIGTGDVSENPWGGSTGTKIFALVGKVNNTGLVEVPMGRPLREIIFDIGGGVRDGRAFKAVQTGGPSGGCLPASHLDMPVDFDRLADAGSMMGSGGMIVMDESTCMVDVARYFIDFLIEESCGKCVPCREGLTQMGHMLHAVCDGTATDKTLEALEALASVVHDASLCALGQSAPNPVLSTLHHFRDEYLAHIRDRRCPAAVCKALLTFAINDKCNGCAVCARECPADAIAGERKKLHAIDAAKCTHCGACRAVCKFDAVDVR